MMLLRRLERWRGFLLPLASVALSLLVLAAILALMGRDPLAVGRLFVSGSLGSADALVETLLKATPLLIAGLGAVVAFQAGVFNVGLEGQLLLGALAAGIVGYAVALPPVVHWLVAFAAAALVGGAYAYIPGYLKAYRGVNEILSTILLNYPALYLVHWLASSVLKAPGVVPATPRILPSAALPALIPGSRLHVGFAIALVLAVAVYWLLHRTVVGLEFRAVGLAPVAASHEGINPKRCTVMASVISGALAGVAGATEVLGIHGRFLAQFSPGYGFDAMIVALLANLNALGAVPSALFFGMLKTGALEVQVFAAIPRQITQLYFGIVFFFLAARNLISHLGGRLRAALTGHMPHSTPEEAP